MKRNDLILLISMPLFSVLSACQNGPVQEIQRIQGEGDIVEVLYSNPNVLFESIMIANIPTVTSKGNSHGIFYFHNATDLANPTDKRIVIQGQQNIINRITLDCYENTFCIYGEPNTEYITESFRVDLWGYEVSSAYIDNAGGYVNNYTFVNNPKLMVTNSGFAGIYSVDVDSLDVTLTNSGWLRATDAKINNYLFIKGDTHTNATIENLVCDKADFVLKNNSWCKVSGEINEFSADFENNSNFAGADCKAKTAKIDLRSSSEVVLDVDLKIEGTLKKQSRLVYYGEPKLFLSEISGGSSITKAVKVDE